MTAMYLPGTTAPFLLPSYRLPWAFVRRRFGCCLENLKITADQAADGERKLRGVVECLNRAYWGVNDGTSNRALIGSWGKGTRVRPPRDIDILFVLPPAVYHRFERRTGNRQSQLLQDVKDVLFATNPQTRIRADGQVVEVPFNTYAIEVAPGFAAEGGGYLICDSNVGGRYKWVHPEAELAYFDAIDRQVNGNVRKLTRLLKQWQRYCDVPIKSFQIEALMKELLPSIWYGGCDEFWFDWLVRDAFAYMIGRANGWFRMPVTGEAIFLGDAWLSKARTASSHALRACAYEYDNYEFLAGNEWQEIFGPMIPATVS